MLTEPKLTQRGFAFYEFSDRNEQVCQLQMSSLATERAIWLGVKDANPQVLVKGRGWCPYSIPNTVLLHTRMHLTQSQVADILPILQKFVETGEI